MLLRKVVCAFTLLAATSAVMGQVATGNYTFGTFDNKGIDTINVGNLNVDLSIPVLNKAGRGMPFYYNLRYDSSVWSPATVSGATVWTPTQAFGWHGDTEVETGYVSYSTEYFTFTDPDGEDFTETIHDNFTYHDPFGVQHWFETSTVNMYCWGTLQPAYCTEQYPSFTESAIDGSGYTLTVSNYTTSAITGATGKQFAVSSTSSGAATDTDSNGNQISVNSSGQFTDTLGDVVLSVSGNAPNPVTFMYTNPKGTSSNYKMNYELYTVKTDFGVSGVTEYGPLSNSLVSSITLPDGSSYSFTYEETPGSCTPVSGTYSSNCVTGRIASVTLPTGGTINYSYSGGNNGIESDGSTAGLTRTLSTGGSWKYSRALVSGTPGPGSTWTTTVVDPSNNNTLVNFMRWSRLFGQVFRVFKWNNCSS
jgi:hypothetical protein